MKILELGWRVKFFLREGKARKDFFHKMMKSRGILYFCLVVSTNPSEKYDRQIGVHLPQV